MESSELTRKRALAATLYAARQNPVDADMVTRNNRLKAAAQAFVAPYNQSNYMNAPCCPPGRTGGAASDYGDSRLDEAVFAGTAVNTFTNVMDRRAGAAICCGPPPATTLPQGVRLYGDCSCGATIPGAPEILSVISGDASLIIVFAAPMDGGSPITNYFYSTDNGATFTSANVSSSPFTITGLINKTTYQIIIRAVNIVGQGPDSNMLPGTPDSPMIINLTTTNPNSLMVLPYDGLGAGGITVDWGDGTIQKFTVIPIQHTYVAASNYTIKVTGLANSYGFFGDNTYTGAQYITSVTQWGLLGLKSIESAFNGSINLLTVPTTIPSSVTNIRLMFKNAKKFNSDISKWDVSNCTDMAFVFQYAALFNQNLSDWNVSNVTTMSGMFFGALSFNSPLNWGNKTNKVTNMGLTFSASGFNQDISGWDVSNVERMDNMFSDTSAFNNGGQPLNWGAKTGKVTNMFRMFFKAANFNQDISGWDVSNVESMGEMFGDAVKFNQNLTIWNVSKVNSMFGMFRGAFDFNSPLTWGAKTAAVINMSQMFQNAKKFNQNISGWGVGLVSNMSDMFAGALVFNWDLSIWNVTNVTNMAGMFGAAAAFNSPLNWGSKTALVQDMGFMFANATSFNQDVSGWSLNSLQSTFHMFENATQFNNGGQPLTWGAKTSSILNMNGMFIKAINFNQDISGWDVSNVTDMRLMFNNASLFNQNLSIWNVSKVQNMTQMFEGATAFNSPLTWGNKTALVQNMAGMFVNSSFNQDISGWDVSSVTNMAFMFFSNSAFNNGGQPLTWGNKTQNVTDMGFMFKGATNFNADITGWNVTSVTTMSQMFQQASIFDQILSTWTPTALTNITNMFCFCPNMSYPANLSKYPQKIKDLIAAGQNVNC